MADRCSGNPGLFEESFEEAAAVLQAVAEGLQAALVDGLRD